MNDTPSIFDKFPSRSGPRVGTCVLIVSVLVNCFLLGLLAAPLLAPHPHFPPPGGEHFIDHLTEGQTPADADALRKIYAQQETDLTAAHTNMETAMHNMRAVLEKPAVDPAELQKALDDITAAHGQIQQGMAGLIQGAATNLSPEGRKIFAENGLHPPGMHAQPNMHMSHPTQPPIDAP